MRGGEPMNAGMRYGGFSRPFRGLTVCGDRFFTAEAGGSVVAAVIDGLGHGFESSEAAERAVEVIRDHLDLSPEAIVLRCHEGLRATRGVVLSLAAIDQEHGMMTWAGVGNVQGALMRAGAQKGSVQEVLLLRGGVVGSQLPALQAAVLPVAKGDTLVFVTDGVRGDFAEGLSARESPQRAADGILERHCRGNDDALVLVVRLTGVHA